MTVLTQIGRFLSLPTSRSHLRRYSQCVTEGHNAKAVLTNTRNLTRFLWLTLLETQNTNPTGVHHVNAHSTKRKPSPLMSDG